MVNKKTKTIKIDDSIIVTCNTNFAIKANAKSSIELYCRSGKKFSTKLNGPIVSSPECLASKLKFASFLLIFNRDVDWIKFF